MGFNSGFKGLSTRYCWLTHYLFVHFVEELQIIRKISYFECKMKATIHGISMESEWWMIYCPKREMTLRNNGRRGQRSTVERWRYLRRHKRHQSLYHKERKKKKKEKKQWFYMFVLVAG